MIKDIQQKINSMPKSLWILIFIVALGTFVRAYHLHAWLDFGSDQVNDATRVSTVVTGQASWPLLGPDMSSSGKGGRGNRYKLGPIYYDFEIIAAKLFGNYPDKLAYPDTIFGILSVPLLYYFLRRYFAKDVSLALTGIYSVSFYALKFSHSAWNVNSIPFFTILFLLSLWKFLAEKEKVSWVWVLLLSISWGVGIQLHAILLALFTLTAFAVFGFLLKQNFVIIKKSLAVLLLVAFINGGQIISELKTNFANTKIFFMTISDNSEGDPFGRKFAQNVLCSVQANSFMLTGSGSDICDLSLLKLAEGNASDKVIKNVKSLQFVFSLLATLAFTVLGYYALFRFFKTEKNQHKKYFLGLILTYCTISFLVMTPVIDAPLRYFVHIFFVPLIFLGIGLEYLKKKMNKKKFILAFSITLALLLINNLIAINSVAAQLINKTRSGQDALVLGEVEDITQYIIKNSGNKQEAYLLSNTRYSNFYKSLSFIAEKNNFHIQRANDISQIPHSASVFYLWENSSKNPQKYFADSKILINQDFGQVGLYKLQNN